MERISFGMGPVALGDEGAELRRRFAKILADALRMKVTIVATQSYGRLLRRAAAQDLSLAWLPPAIYVRLANRLERTRVLLGCVRAEPGQYHAALFVRPDSKRTKPEDLAGARVGWVDPNSCAGYLFPRFALLSRGLTPDALFSEERFLRSHERVVEAVHEGEVDAGATYVQMSGSEDDAEVLGSGWRSVGADMRPVLITRSIPVDAVCKVGDLDDAVQDAVVATLSTMHESGEGADVLRNLLQVERFEPVDPHDYEVVRAALNVAHLPILGDD